MARRLLHQRVVIYFFSRWLLLSVVLSTSHAEVVLDGSVGPSGALPGPNFDISADLGIQRGGNLFHSFRSFNLNSTESATFSGPDSVENILSRVTGGRSSTIDGLLRSTIPEADLYFINPAGVMFGPNAQLDVQGSFHVSTADFIRLADGVRFNAVPSTEDALLKTAPPEAFGFLGNNPGEIKVQSDLDVKLGKNLSLIGREITLSGSELSAPSGTINLVSLEGDDQLRGPITVSDSEINTNGGDGGYISIIGGEVNIEGNSEISAQNESEPGRDMGILIQAEKLTLNKADLITSSQAEALGGGGITIRVRGEISAIGGSVETGQSQGKAGDIFIEAASVTLSNDAAFRAESRSQEGGDIKLKVKGDIQLNDDSFLSTRSFFGTPGDISVTAKKLILTEVAEINNETDEGRSAGKITLHAMEAIRLEGKDSKISSRTFEGEAGEVNITTPVLELSGGASIRGATEGSGQGANINITATETLTLTGKDTKITTASGEEESTATGNAGNIAIKSGRLVLSEDAEITARTSGAGTGGKVDITATEVQVSQGGRISAESESESLDAGPSGDLIIHTDTLELLDESQINVATENAKAGSITLHMGNLLLIQDKSGITTSVQGGEGQGGNITINESKPSDQTFLVLDATSEVVAQAVGGPGGNININLDTFTGPRENVDASSSQNISGTVAISAPETNIISGTLPLSASFLEAASLLGTPCAEQMEGKTSRFVVRGRAGMPPEPDTLLPGQASDLMKISPQPEGESSPHRDILPLPATGEAGFQMGC